MALALMRAATIALRMPRLLRHLLPLFAFTLPPCCFDADYAFMPMIALLLLLPPYYICHAMP